MVHNVSLRKTVSGYLQLLQLFILSCTAVSLNPCVHETMDMHVHTVSSSSLLSLPFPVLLPLPPLFLFLHWRFCCSFKVKKMAWCQLKIPSEVLGQFDNTLGQGSSNLILEGRSPAEFSSNLPQHTCLEVSSIPIKTLISCFRCVWLGLELNSAGTPALQDRTWWPLH